MTARPVIHRTARTRANSYDPKAGTIDVVWSTGATVRRFDPWTGEEYDEALSMLPSAVRLDRLNAGAALLDSHDDGRLGSVLGAVVKGSARIEDGQGHAIVKLSAAPGVADQVQKIAEGTVVSVSVGYWIHAVEEVDGAGGVPLRTATDWEPLELSAVAVPADPGAQFRSATAHRARRTGLTGRAADIRRYARSAGLPRLGEKHVRAGTSAAAFFDLAAQRLARRTATRTQETPDVAKPSPNFSRDYAGGAAAARDALKPSLSGLDTYAGIGRAVAKPAADDDDDESDGLELDDDLHDDEDEDHAEEALDAGSDDEVDEASDKVKAKKDAADRRRGAEAARGLLGRGGRGVRGSAMQARADVQEGRREARRADGRRVDDALSHEAGRREAEALLGKARR